MEEVISLQEIFTMLKKRIGVILGSAALGLVLASIVTFFFLTAQYESTANLVVNQKKNQTTNVQLNEIQTDIQMITTYKEIMTQSVILDEVSEEIKMDKNYELSSAQLKGMVTVNSQQNSQVFSVTVKDTDPYRAADVANTVTRVFKKKIPKIMNVDNVSITSKAIPNTKPVAPKNALNMAIGLVLGVMVGIGLAFLFEFMDKTVKDEKFLTDLGFVTLGVINEMNANELKAKPLFSKGLMPEQSRKEKYYEDTHRV